MLTTVTRLVVFDTLENILVRLRTLKNEVGLVSNKVQKYNNITAVFFACVYD